MKLLRRRATEPEPELEPDVADEPIVVTKGRPTPKRRDAAPRRGPVTAAPQTRKEALKWQREQAARGRSAGGASAAPVRGPAYREAMRRGDASVLPPRDHGPYRKLARDFVDSRRLLSNYLLVLFPVMIVGFVVPFLNLLVIILFFAVVGDWYVAGRRINALARSRGITPTSGPWGVGFYAGQRAYLPRRWRMPGPQVALGDPI